MKKKKKTLYGAAAAAHAKKRGRSYVSNPGKPARSYSRDIVHAARRGVQRASAAGRVLRSYRRNPSSVLVDTGLLVLGAGAGAVVGSKAFSMLPVGNTLFKNGAQTAVGAALAFYGYKKKNHLIMGAGVGCAAAGVARIATNALPMLAGEGEYTQDEMLGIAADLEGEYDEYMGAPASLAAPAEMADPFAPPF